MNNLKYIIFDMYNYTYFNYDVSLTKNAIFYYLENGFKDEDEHNYAKNKNFHNSIKTEMKILSNAKELSNNKKLLFKELFEVDNIDIKADYGEEIYNDFPSKESRSKCVTTEEIAEYISTHKESSIEKYNFEDTIKENIQIFKTILDLLISINPEIKIYLALVPVHEVEISTKHKKEFYNIINKFKKKYKFKFLDFYNYKDISSNNCYFYDVDHLNYNGATAFTKLLNSYIDY